ncbi:MAG TPA: thioredoxin domain-containing protein [Solirubrobacteraceae bacterium]|jgi:protein-disulfide isomerase
MASRQQQKQRARAARLSAEATAARNAQRSRRAQLLSGTALVVGIVVIAIVVISSAAGNHRPSGLATGKARHAISGQVDSLLAGIPEHGETLGDPRARYTLTLFGDLQCPVCAALATGANLDGTAGGLPEFIARQVRPGHAKLVYRSMCTATCNDFGQSTFDEQQAAAYAAGMQSRFWYYEELFYHQQGAEGTRYVTQGFLSRLAGEVPGLKLRTWIKDRGDPTLLGQIQADERNAARQLPLIDGGRGTPGLIISGPAGRHFIAESTVDYDQLKAAIRTVS